MLRVCVCVCNVNHQLPRQPSIWSMKMEIVVSGQGCGALDDVYSKGKGSVFLEGKAQLRN